MSITQEPTAPTEVTTPIRRAAGDLSVRLAGAGAITFALVVVAQNLIRGASAPAMDAGGAEILTHYAGHDVTSYVLAATYVVTGIGMALFLGGASRRLLSSGRPGWAVTGIVGAVSIMGLFAIVVGAEQAIGVVANHAHPDLGAIEALWALHNSVFTVLDFSIAVALIGLSRAGIAAGVTPVVFARLAPIGSVLLLVGTLTGPATAAGDTMAFFAITVVGFLVWLSFLVVTGLRLVRERS